MDEHPHTMTEPVTLFSPEASAGGSAAAEQQHIEELAARLGLGRPQLSALHAVMTWAAFLRPSTEPHDRERLRTYLDLMGYLPADRKIVASAERSRDAIDAAVPTLLEGFVRGELDAETFPQADDGQQSARLAGLTPSQLDLLGSILRHQRALDGADLRDLLAQFPFPVTSVNFFGRFVAGGCDDPRKAIRYLRLCTPFFVRVRSLLEGLSNDRFRFLVIQGVCAAKEYTDDEPEEPAAPDGKQPPTAIAPPVLEQRRGRTATRLHRQRPRLRRRQRRGRAHAVPVRQGAGRARLRHRPHRPARTGTTRGGVHGLAADRQPRWCAAAPQGARG